MRQSRILVLGAGGLMGRYLVGYGGGAMRELQGLARQELDITDPNAVAKVLDRIKPDWVINAAACARMEKCAEDPVKTARLNVEAPAWLAEQGKLKGFRFCHVSSDYVFEGKARQPYVEESAAGPLSEYGRQKAAADVIVSSYPQHLLLRVAWLFGQGGGTFMSMIPKLLMERPVLQVAGGRKGNCLYMGIGAGWIFELIERDAGGTFNLVQPGETTWEEFAHLTLEELKKTGIESEMRKN